MISIPVPQPEMWEDKANAGLGWVKVGKTGYDSCTSSTIFAHGLFRYGKLEGLALGEWQIMVVLSSPEGL